MVNENYNEAITKWKEDVADTFDGFARNAAFELDLDFYAFQSAIRFSPPLLMIGANPGGEESYTNANQSKNRLRRNAEDLANEENQFLSNPSWRSSSLCHLFSGETLYPMFEQAVITNFTYFNTTNFAALKKRRGVKEIIAYSKMANKRLIEILQPQNIILMGNIPLHELAKYFDQPMFPILKTNDGVSAMIRKTSIDGIPTYWIHHPSMNKKFNTGENLKMKRDTLEKHLKNS